MESSSISLIRKIIIDKVFFPNYDNNGSWIFDFRKVSLTPEFLDLYVSLFFERYGNKEIQVCGLESASISLISAIVLESKKRGTPVNGFFIRKSRKKHDLCKAVEGEINDKPVVIVDDILNTGKSILSQLEVLKECKVTLDSIFTIIRFRDTDFYDFLKKELSLNSLFELNDFKNTLPVENLVQKKDTNILPLPYKIFWKFKGGEANFKLVVPKSAPLLYKNYIYFGTDHGFFFCLNTEDGEVIWKYKIQFGPPGKLIISSPVVYKDTVFFGAYDGNVYAFNALTGEKKWTYYDADWIGSSPSVSDRYNLLYIGLEYGLFKKKGGVAAIDINTGKEVWKDFHEGLTHCSPYYSKKNNLVIISSNDNTLHVYNAKNGKKLKTQKLPSVTKASFSESEDGRLIAFGDLEGYLYTLNAKTLEVKETCKAHFGIYSTPIWNKTSVIFGSLDKNVYCFDIKENKIQWIFKTSGRIFASPIIYKNHVYIGSNDGRLYRINLENGKEFGYIQLSERIINKISIDEKEDILYIPTIANELYKIKLVDFKELN